MKKFLLSFIVLGFILSTNVVMATSFDRLDNLSEAQKQRLTQVQFGYKKQIDEIETRIMSYKNKLAQVKADTTKSQEQINLVASAYERNISTLETQKKQLEAQASKAYKMIMTPEQYQQYSAQQMQVQDAFQNFVRTAK